MEVRSQVEVRGCFLSVQVAQLFMCLLALTREYKGKGKEICTGNSKLIVRVQKERCNCLLKLDICISIILNLC